MSKKKIISLALALVMALGMFNVPAMAAGVTLSLDKTNYAAGEKIIVSYSGVTSEMEKAQAWVGTAKVGAAANGYDKWKYVAQGSGQIELTAPKENGSYEVRFYQGNSASDTNLIKSASVPFTVGGSSDSSGDTSGNVPGGGQSAGVVYPVKSDFNWDLVDFATGKHSFTGTYETSYDTLSLVQSGDKVTGQYPEWDNGRIDGTVVDGVLYGYWYESPSYSPPDDAGQIVFVMNADGKEFTGWWRYGNEGLWKVWSKGNRNSIVTSGWANEEVSKADALGLIPDSIRDKDLKQNITRKEFAAVAVKVYENLTGKKVTPAAKNPFTDTSDPEVLKAYNVGITSGTSATTFSPDVLLNREQCATMLTRVLKASYIPDWTLATDGNYTLTFTSPAKFADNAKISDWAKPSVYFMAVNGIISGTGNNMFSPRAITAAEIAVNYASATREQALVIGARLVENMGGKPLDYKEGGGTTEPTKPTDPPSGEKTINPELVGTWRGGLNGIERFYKFNSDGTYMCRVYSDAGGTVLESNLSAKSLLIKGVWREAGGTIYFTQVHQFAWVRGSEPPENIEWVKGDDNTLNIKTGEAPLERDGSPLPGKWIKVLDYVYVTPDGSLPDAYLWLKSDTLPSWAFPK